MSSPLSEEELRRVTGDVHFIRFKGQYWSERTKDGSICLFVFTHRYPMCAFMAAYKSGRPRDFDEDIKTPLAAIEFLEAIESKVRYIAVNPVSHSEFRPIPKADYIKQMIAKSGRLDHERN